jgi:hypothetical protein
VNHSTSVFEQLGNRDAYEPNVRPGIHRGAIIRQRVHDQKDLGQFILDVRETGLDQRLGLIRTMPIDYKLAIN